MNERNRASRSGNRSSDPFPSNNRQCAVIPEKMPVPGMRAHVTENQDFPQRE